MKKIFIILSFLSLAIIANAQWQKTSLRPSMVSSLTVDGNTIFAGTMGGYGIFSSTNNGVSWNHLGCDSNGVNSNSIWSLASSGNNIYAGTDWGVYLSTNNGVSWNQKGSYDTTYAVALRDNYLFAGTYQSGVFLSTNNGANWTFDGLAGTGVTSFAFKDSNIFAGTAGSGIFRSTNNGTSWTVADTGSIYSWNDVNAILINGSNIFEAVGGNGIFRSTNNGTSWTAVNTGIALQNNISINSLANVGNNIFAGTDGGVYLTTNNGASWHPINTGLTDTSIWSLACNGSYIFAGTSNYNGIWKRALSEVICSAYFSLTADTNTPHHYIAINNAIGVHPIKYVWSWGDGTHDTIAYPSHIYSTAGNYTICLQITDSTGCTNTYCDSSYYLSKSPNSIITVDVVPQIITGINLKELSNSIKVYPNPAINSVTIETQQQSTIEILNIQGQTMLQQHLQQGKINIDISRLTKGVYILRLNNNDKTVVTKIVKE